MSALTAGRATWRRPLALTSAAIAALALAACSPSTGVSGDASQSGGRVASDPSLDAAWQKASFADFYKQKIEWRACTAEDGLDEQITPPPR